MRVLEISLTWQPENIGWNATNENEEYLANSKDPRRVTSSNITVKVRDKILKVETQFDRLLILYKRLAVKR